MKHFSPEDDRVVRTDWANHVLVEVIAKKLRRSPAVVRQRVQHLGLRRSSSVTRVVQWAPPHLVARRRRIGDDAFVREAIAWREAEAMRPVLEREEEVARMAKVIARSQKTRDEKIYEMRQAGMTLQAIADEFDVTRQRVMQIIHEMEDVAAPHRMAKSFRRLSRSGKAEFMQKIGSAAT